MSNTTLTKQQAIEELWRRGKLFYKLDSVQKELYDSFYNDNSSTRVWLLSRRAGKSYLLCVLASEACIRKPNTIIKYVAQSKMQVNSILRPLMKKIFEDCPEDLKPEFHSKDYVYYFKNGSEIQIAGTDNGHAEKLRGGDSHIFIVDEAGSCSDLNNIVKSILLPTTLTTEGKGILASTPPREPDHDFNKFIEDAEMRKTLTIKTIMDNPRLTPQMRDKLFLEMGGEHTPEARRELFCEMTRDLSTTAVPEFSDELAKEIIKTWPKPPHYDAYIGMDLGGRDLTVVLFGYYDFRADKVIIEDEIVMDFKNQDNNIKTLTERIMDKEKQLWMNIYTNEQIVPHRFSDINHMVLQEIQRYSDNKVYFTTTKKDQKIAAINNLRVLLTNKKIIINPKCETLIRHLKNVKWDKTKDIFARSPDDGHYDAVDALVYLVRNLMWNKNPYPRSFETSLTSKDLFVRDPDKFYGGNQTEVLKKIFNVKRKTYGQ